MKIAIAGKGGVGKTTVTALICWAFQQKGYNVLAVDADPDANLADVLGFTSTERIVPIAEMKELIRERMEIKDELPGWFKMNPYIDDIPQKYIKENNGIKLIVMGTVKAGAKGCVCPENVFLKNLLYHLILRDKEQIVVDFEAGVEHLGRATAMEFDHLIVVVEPTRLSLDSFLRIRPLAQDLGIKAIWALANKVRNEEEIKFIKTFFEENVLLGLLPYSEVLLEASIKGNWHILRDSPLYRKINEVVAKLEVCKEKA